MITLQDIFEIKKKLVHAKLALWQGLHDLIHIEEIDLIDLMDAKSIPSDRLTEIRKKVARAKGLIGMRLNPLFELLRAFSVGSSNQDAEDR
jgi:hypothetical protein